MRPDLSMATRLGRAALLLSLLFSLSLTGCLKSSSEINSPDASAPDATLDAATPDSALPDAALPDQGLPDQGLPDAGQPDAACQSSDEICDGQDNDCDDRVDEDFPELGDPCTVGVGLCTRPGGMVCALNGDTRCDATQGPQAEEICDGEDNDCDGATDEDFPTLGEVCTVGLGACQESGLADCGPDGDLICTAEPGEPSEELCNGVDDDCNGTVDDPFPTVGQPCQVGLGECARAGLFICGPEGLEALCDVTPGDPAPEQCNGLDDDCDGVIDETPMGQGDPCQTGAQGVCADGLLRCAGGALQCEGQASPSPERCNGVDDDCDGTIDEDPQGQGDPCATGQPGQCQAGTLQCEAGEQSCQANTPASPERCDDLDNDCDGATDETFEGLGERCSNGVGACRRVGTLRCQPDGLSAFCAGPQPGQPGVERCGDNIDNDCDGATDEGFEDLGAECADGEFRCRQVGLVICEGGALMCNATALPSEAERCDDIDNDCDGETDEGFPELGQPCVARVGVCENEGVFVCDDAGGLTCNAPQPESTPERLDCRDNDCDGATDEGLSFRDADQDGLADVCDRDRDGDGRVNEEDLCPDDGFITDGPDPDGDGLANVCDADADGDGHPDTWVPHIVFSPDNTPGDEFGRAIKLVGDTLYVGSPMRSPEGSGRIYEYALDGLSPPRVIDRIDDPRMSASGRFGDAIDVQGDRLLTSTPWTDALPPAIHLYERDVEGVWRQISERTGPRFSLFGESVALSGDLVFAGAPLFGGTFTGNATLYTALAGPLLEPLLALQIPDFRERGGFGRPGVFPGDALFVGETGLITAEGPAPSGRVHTFQPDLDGQWQWTGAILSPLPSPDDLFGYNIVKNGDTLWVAALNTRFNGVGVGGVFGFQLDPDTEQWQPTTTLTHPRREPSAIFGRSLAAIPGWLMVGSVGSGGATGAAFLYRLTEGNAPELVVELTPQPGAGLRLGVSMEMSEAYVIISAPDTFDNEATRGALYVYPRVTDNCPGVPNPDQADADGDGIGDACAP